MQDSSDKSEKIIISLLIILIVLLAFLLCFIIFKIIQRDIINKRKEPQVIQVHEKKEEVNNLLTASQVRDIYNSIFNESVNNVNVMNTSYNNDVNYYSYIYTSGIVYINDLFSLNDKYVIAAKKIPNEKITYETNEYNINIKRFSNDALKEKYNLLFGNNTYVDANFSGSNFSNCIINENIYTCNDSELINNSNMKLVTIYDSYNEEDNMLYIYEYVAYYNQNNYSFSLDQYGYNILTDLGNTSLEEPYEELLRTNYKNYFTKYQHTFKLNDDNTYNWISTEPIVQS